MTGWGFIVSLLSTLVFSQGQATKTRTIMSCSTENVRSKAVDNVLAAMECNSINCGRCNASHVKSILANQILCSCTYSFVQNSAKAYSKQSSSLLR